MLYSVCHNGFDQAAALRAVVIIIFQRILNRFRNDNRSCKMYDRADNQAVWEGRAWVEAKDGSPASQPALAAAKLAEALFKDFPGESGTTISVP